MEHWYVLEAASGKEEAAVKLLKQTPGCGLWSFCSVPKRLRVFRSGGMLHLLEGTLFPGYVFVKTDRPKELAGELNKARAFPKFIDLGADFGSRSRAGFDSRSGTGRRAEKDFLFPIEELDLAFLQHVCGENLQRVMGVTQITLNEGHRIIRAEGVLNPYLNRIVKLNLHKRFAVVEIPLFNRMQQILFGLQLEQDLAEGNLAGQKFADRNLAAQNPTDLSDQSLFGQNLAG